MENKEYSRRKFINKCLGSFSVFFGGAVVLQSCNSNDSGEEKKDPGQGKEDQVKSGKPCDDLSGVSATEIEKRQKFGLCMDDRMRLDRSLAHLVMMDGQVRIELTCHPFEWTVH